MRLWAILDESVLHRMVGGPAVMAAQWIHLLKVIERPEIQLQETSSAIGERISRDLGPPGQRHLAQEQPQCDPGPMCRDRPDAHRHRNS
ncbi:MAG: Scr1 family TA system antitoxin-like transcriptional regulator [Pseudonocardiaceae bacterium]